MSVPQDGTSTFSNGYYSVSLQIQMTTDSSNTWSSAPECLLTYSGSSTINMEVLPYFENLLSSTGYLGEAPQLSSVYGEYFNTPSV